VGADGGARLGDGALMLQTPPAKAVILDAEGLRRAWRRIAHEIIERQPNLAQLSLLGIVTRGLPLAQRLAATLEELEGVRLPVIPLDVRAYRDDLPRAAAAPLPVLPAATVDGRPILLVDDVLFNGRTVRAAIDAVIAAGRPTQIQLAVLVDRGHRELPIRPDYIGKNVPTSRQEWVDVHLSETDGEDAVRILERSES
jgi:pyrimidine operon attenuation protein/uracil phosphoribosyltransferase